MSISPGLHSQPRPAVLPDEAKSEPDKVISIAAVGDLMVGDTAISPGFGFASRYPENSSATIAQCLAALIGDCDIAFGNLECTLSHKGHDPERWRSSHMRGLPIYASVLRKAGFNVLNIANNHATQHGRDSFFHTVGLLQEHGIEVCGLRGSSGWCSHPLVLDIRQQKVGMLGYSLRPRQYSTEEPPYAEGSPEAIIADIRRLRAQVDLVIVSLHWGEEYVTQPSQDEVELGRAIVDAGGSLVIGHHPHVARRIELYHHGAIAYSLGNFAADMIWQDVLRKSILMRCSFADRLTDVEAVPVYIGDDFLPREYSEANWAVVEDHGNGLTSEHYLREVRRTVRRQQFASYRYAARKLFSYPPRLLGQLLLTTVRNKLFR